MSIKKIVCAVSVRQAVYNESLLLWKVVQGWQWLDIKCNWRFYDSVWYIYIYIYIYEGKITLSTIKRFGIVDDEMLDQILQPNIPRNKGFNNL